MEQSLSCKEISSLFWKPRNHYRVKMSMILISILQKINQAHNTLYFFMVDHNTVSSSHLSKIFQIIFLENSTSC